MKTYVNFGAAAVALWLLACPGSAQTMPSGTPYGKADISKLAVLLVNLCVKTMPSFAGFDAVAAANKLTPLQVAGSQRRVGATSLYILTGHKGMALTANKRGLLACGLGFAGPEDIPAIGKKFIAAVAKATGGSPVARYETDFEFAYRLKSGSIFTHQVIRQDGEVRSIFLISPPIADSQVRTYLYD